VRPARPVALVDLAEFARSRGMTARQARYQIRRHGAPAVPDGGRWRIDPAAWDAWFAATPLERARIRRDAFTEAAQLVRNCAAEMRRGSELEKLHVALRPWLADIAIGYVTERLAAALADAATRDGLPLRPARRPRAS
jgi:hypothetical protein